MQRAVILPALAVLILNFLVSVVRIFKPQI